MCLQFLSDNMVKTTKFDKLGFISQQKIKDKNRFSTNSPLDPGPNGGGVSMKRSAPLI